MQRMGFLASIDRRFGTRRSGGDSSKSALFSVSRRTLVRRAPLALLAGVLVVLEAGVPGGSAAAATHASKTVKPDYSFYRGKTITYMVSGAPGSTPGVVALAMQPGLEQYLGATVNLVYSTAANPVPEDAIAAAKPDGLTVGNLAILTMLSAQAFNAPSVNFKMANESWLGSTNTVPFLEVGCNETAFSSFASVIKGKTPLTYINILGSNLNLFQNLLMTAWPVPNKAINGYTSTTLPAGCERGDGNVTNATLVNFLDVAGTAVTPGITPLLLTESVPSNSTAAFLNRQVPTLAAFAKAHPPKTAAGKKALNIAIAEFTKTAPQYATYGPAGIPKARALALTNAIQVVSTQAATKQLLLAHGIPAGNVKPPAIVSFIKSQTNELPLIRKYVNP